MDAATLVAALFGRTAGAMVEVVRHKNLVTSDRVVTEVRRRITLGLNRPELVPILDELLTLIVVVPVESLSPLLDDAERLLRNAVASRNGSTRDAHVLALARDLGADIWSTDRDFAGTGVASWSTTNLMWALQFPANAD